MKGCNPKTPRAYSGCALSDRFLEEIVSSTRSDAVEMRLAEECLAARKLARHLRDEFGHGYEDELLEYERARGAR